MSDWLSTSMPSETGVVTGGFQFCPKLNLRLAIFQHRLAGGPVDHRAANFDQALAAHADRLHLGVVAEDRDIDADLFGGVHDQGALREL